jgi:hypothetical protein
VAGPCGIFTRFPFHSPYDEHLREFQARVPKSIIQEGKKGFRSLAIVFMKIQAVTDFAERYDAEKRARLPGIIAGIK